MTDYSPPLAPLEPQPPPPPAAPAHIPPTHCARCQQATPAQDFAILYDRSGHTRRYSICKICVNEAVITRNRARTLTTLTTRARTWDDRKLAFEIAHEVDRLKLLRTVQTHRTHRRTG